MNPNIKKWVNGTLQCNENGDVIDTDLSKIKANFFTIKDSIDSLVTHAKTQDGYRLNIKQGLKNTKVSPLTFLAALTRTASEIAFMNAASNRYLSSMYSAVANYGLHKIHSTTLELIAEQGFEQGVATAGINDHFENSDQSLNIPFTLIQMKTFFSQYPSASQPKVKEQIQNFIEGKGAIVDFPFSESDTLSVIGINSYFLTKVLSETGIDYPALFVSCDDSNPLYMYRVSNDDFMSAALIMSKIADAVELDENKSLINEYAQNITKSVCNTFNVAEKPCSLLLDLRNTNNAPSTIAELLNASQGKSAVTGVDNDHLNYAIQLGYSFSSSRGVSPMGTSDLFSASQLLSGDNQSAVQKAIQTQINEAALHVARNAFKKEEFEAAQVELDNFMREVRI